MGMLSLEDHRWGVLQHAYGPAKDIPELLRRLRSSTGPRTDGQEELWESLWSRLCHQGDVYTASYAAVPHIVQIVGETRAPIDFSFFALPAAIEVARKKSRGPQVPADCALDYHRAVKNLWDVVNLHRDDPWDQDMLLSAMAAQAVSKGHIDLAEALLNLDSDQIASINRLE